MKSRFLPLAGVAALLVIPVAGADARGLGGSATSMREQHAIAVERDLTFISDADEVERALESGELEMIATSADVEMAGVSYPYAVPQAKLFIQRLGAQYREATGTRLVVTSLTRPLSNQPGNAHRLSVHPAGMAVDFRVPADAASRRWLENTLLELENSGLLDVTRERNPPHYHVAVFPLAYGKYAAKRIAAEKAEARIDAAEVKAVATTPAAAPPARAAREQEGNLSRVLLPLLAFIPLATGTLVIGRRAARSGISPSRSCEHEADSRISR